MMRRLRKACETQSVSLSGLVEINETYIGGKEHTRKGHKPTDGFDGRQAVLGLRERGGNTVAQSVSGIDRLTLWIEMQKTVEKGQHPLYQRSHHLPEDRTDILSA